MKNRFLIKTIFIIIILSTVFFASCTWFQELDDGYFTITFLANGGELTCGDEVQKVQLADEIIAPSFSKIGYDFVGFDKDLKTLKDDTEVGVIWRAKKYTLNIDSDGGNGEIDFIKVTFDSEIGELPVLEKEGYTFSHYTLDGTLITKDYIYRFDEDKTIKANYNVKKYKITYKCNGGELSNLNPNEYCIEDDVQLYSPLKVGYDFLGWEDEDGNLVNSIERGSCGDKVLTAKYSAKQFLLHINTNGGKESVEDIVVTYNKPIGELPNVTKDGYLFNYYKIDDAVIVSGTIWKYDEDKTANVIFRAIIYTITYYNNGGSYSGDVVRNYTADEEVDLYSPLKNGYTFMGWQDEENNIVNTIEKGTIGNKIFVAQYSANEYKIHIDGNGGTGDTADIIICYGETISTLPILEKSGFTFDGWVKEDSTRIYIGSIYNYDRDITIKALWSLNPYSITYKLNGGSFSTNISSSYSVEDEFVLPIPTKLGYDFLGWTDGICSEYVTDISLGTMGDKVFTANYKAKEFTLFINANGGTGDTSDIDVEYDSPIGDLPQIEKAGYTFTGFTIDGDLITKTTTWKFTENKTVKAEFNLNVYNLTFELNGGELKEANPTTYSVEDLVSFKSPTKVGYDFLGYTESGSTKLIISCDFTSLGDKVLTANYKAKEFTLFINANGGTGEYQNITVTYNCKIGNLPVLEKSGYNFTDYKIGSDSVTQDTVWDYVENKTLDVVFTAINYNIIFVLDGGTNNESRTTFTVEGLTNIKNPTKTQYNFVGWKVDDSDVTITNGTINQGRTADITLTALWEYKFTTITVRFVLEDISVSGAHDKRSKVNGSETIADIVVTVGQSIGSSMPSSATPNDSENYIFMGYYVLSGETYTLTKVKANTLLTEKFLTKYDIGDDGVLTLYAKLGCDEIGPF